MVPLIKALRFFGMNNTRGAQLALTLLYGKKHFIGEEHEINWGEFACLAFYRKLLPFGWLSPRVEGVCKVAFPLIKEHIRGIKTNKVEPLVALLIDDEVMLVGDDLLFDMTTWEQRDKAVYVHCLNLPQVSLCFMISSIAIKAAERFLQEEPSYASDCPYAACAKHKGGADKS